MAELPESVRSSLGIWLGHHDRVAPGLIEGLYVVGSVALGDWRPGRDIDIVAFTADPATDEDAELLKAAHEAAQAELDVTVDGPRLAWGDVSIPPLPLHRPWSFEGDFRHDAECFEINPVTWYTLAEHGVAVRGEPPARLDVATDEDDRRSFVRENVDTYWRSVTERLGSALEESDRAEFEAETVEWCALGAARMLYTFRTGDVASKTAAGEWAAPELPDHAGVLLEAVRIRTAVDAGPVSRDVLQRTHTLLEDVVRRIARPDG